MKHLFIISIFAIPQCGISDELFYGIYSNLAAKLGEPTGYEMFFLNDGRAGKCDSSVLFQIAEG